MIDTRWDWINSRGGPLVLAEAATAQYWRGALGNSASLSDQTMTDYERACQKNEYLQTIPCAGGEVLVLGDEPLQSTISEGAGGGPIIIRWVYSNIAVAKDTFSIRANLPEITTRTFFRILTGEALLFDSSENLEKAWSAHHRYTFPVGSYEVTTEEMLVEEQYHFLIHRFLPAV